MILDDITIIIIRIFRLYVPLLRADRLNRVKYQPAKRVLSHRCNFSCLFEVRAKCLKICMFKASIFLEYGKGRKKAPLSDFNATHDFAIIPVSPSLNSCGGNMSDSEEEEAIEKQFKVVLLGDPQSGKSSISSRYAKESFTKIYNPTVGVEFYLKRIVLPGPRNVAVKLWDVGGGGGVSEGRMLDKYIYGADAVILVYDVTNQQSFENLEDWIRACKRIMSQQQPESESSLQKKSPTYALVANKIDLEHLRTIKSDRHHRFAQENGLLTYAVSAKSGEGINLAFQKIAAELLGIRLSKTEQEQQQAVVKAEIVTYRQDRLQANPSTSNVKTAICSLQ